MGYFKKRREAAEKKRLDVLMELFMVQAKAINSSVNEGVADAVGFLSHKKHQYEDNMRENLEKLLEYGHADNVDKLAEEVADVIDEKAAVYGYRIAKGKRTELAQDILVALSVKK